MPRVFLTGPPQVAVAPSGEVWVAGYGAYRLRHQPIVLYRRGGTWSRLPDRVLDLAIDAVGDPVPDGLNGVWFEFGLYWSGRAGTAIPGPPNACSNFSVDSEESFMAGVPWTHAVLTGGGCQRSGGGRMEGTVSVTKPQGSRGLS